MLIGIVASHKEKMIPTNLDYQVFFEALRMEGSVEVVDAHLTTEILKKYDALLIGEPHVVLDNYEIGSIANWVREGGQLLVMASMGGDAAPSGSTSKSNLGELLGFIHFEDNSLGIDNGVLNGQPFDTKVMVDTSSLIGHSGLICYDTGCTITVNNLPIDALVLGAPPRSRIVTGVRLTGWQVSARNPYPTDTQGLLFVQYRLGVGSIIAFGAARTFIDDSIIREQTIDFTSWLFFLWLPDLACNEVSRRMRGVQRHRLLHGYPMEPIMNEVNELSLADLEKRIEIGKERHIIIGILPHTFCNPVIKGCGFCTFPQEGYKASAANQTTELVADEVHRFVRKYPDYADRAISAIYFGGGTANLGQKDAFRLLCQSLRHSFNLVGTEVTLEGVPIYHDVPSRLIDILQEEIKNIRPRISMGVQTFDQHQLERMGRMNFGDLETIRRIVVRSRNLGIATSADLLFNLPGQTLNEMKLDIRKLVDTGIEHICLYHLVLFAGLGTEWDKDQSLLDTLPTNKEACDRWLSLQEMLFKEGFCQRTLTNFERTSVRESFEYELRAFQPEKHDWLGFGPSAITLIGDRHFDRALKLMNPNNSSEYGSAMERGGLAHNRCFNYSQRDMRILYITRKIATLSIVRSRYAELFHRDITDDFPREIEALNEAGLISIRDEAIELTNRGIFYADTVAGMFAWRAVANMRLNEIVKGQKPHEEKIYMTSANHSGSSRMG